MRQKISVKVKRIAVNVRCRPTTGETLEQLKGRLQTKGHKDLYVDDEAGEVVVNVWRQST